MSILRFHLDEDCQAAALGAALREHGIDTTTTNEVGTPGLDDDGQWSIDRNRLNFVLQR